MTRNEMTRLAGLVASLAQSVASLEAEVKALYSVSSLAAACFEAGVEHGRKQADPVVKAAHRRRVKQGLRIV